MKTVLFLLRKQYCRASVGVCVLFYHVFQVESTQDVF